MKLVTTVLARLTAEGAPALAPEDDERAAREWLDENARRAGQMWARSHQYDETIRRWREDWQVQRREGGAR